MCINQAMPKRFYSLDILRGFAALIVVLWHWQHFFYVGTQPGVYDVRELPLYDIFSFFYLKGWLAVDLFFTLSGFVFFWLYSHKVSEGIISPVEFTVLRFSRLYPLHFMTLLIVAVGQLWFMSVTGDYFIYPFNDVKHFLLNLLFVSSWGFEQGYSFNAPIWSVSIEVLLYTIFFIYCRLLPVRLIIVMAISIIGFLVLPPYSPPIARGIGSFFMGGCIFLVYKKVIFSGNMEQIYKWISYITVFVWVFTLINMQFDISYFFSQYNQTPGNRYPGIYFHFITQNLDWYWSAIVLFPLSILFLTMRETLRWKYQSRLSFLGDISYSSYLLHFPLQMAVMAIVICQDINRSVFYSTWLMLFFFCALIIISLVVHKYYELPLRSYFRSINVSALFAEYSGRWGIESLLKYITVKLKEVTPGKVYPHMKGERISLSIIFLTIISVYIWTMPRTVVLEDDGLFIMAAYFNGVAHPPGYPLYTLLAHMSTWVPLGSIASRVHLLSGLFAASACVILWVIAFRLFREKVPAYATTLCFGFSLTLWSQSIIAEVYTLNVLFVSIIFLNCLLLIETGKNQHFRQKLNCLFFLYGIALTNHWPLLVLSTPMFIALLWPKRREVMKGASGSMPYLLAGLLPYLWMLIRSSMDIEISFYGPIESWKDFWFYISRQGYHDIDFSPSAGWADRGYFILYSVAETARQFGPAGPVFILGGMIYQFFVLKKNVILALFLGYLGSTVVLICLLGFDYDLLHRAIFRVYPLVSYLCASIWMGTGIVAISRCCIYLGKGTIEKKIPVLGFTMLVSLTTFASNLPENYRSNDFWARDYARTILDSLPADAILFISTDVNVGPIGYLNRVEGYRKDVKLYHSKGQLFDNRLYTPFKVNSGQVKRSLEKFINSTSSPVYYTDELMHGFGKEYYGLYSKVLKDSQDDIVRAVLSPELLGYWSYILDKKKPFDVWERMHYQSVMSDGCRLFIMIHEYAAGEAGNVDELGRLRDGLCDNLQGIFLLIDFGMQKESPDWNYLEQLINKAEARLYEARGKAESALLDYYTGELFSMKGNYRDANLAYLRSIRIWNHPDNPAYTRIK